MSIIVSNYNYDRFVREAIASALMQDYDATEVIVVDDGSIDNSRHVIESFGSRIISIFKENGGQASAWNAGFKVSQGDVIIFLDADDILLTTAARRAVALFDSTDVAKVHWPLWYIDSEGNRLPGRRPEGPLAEGDLRDTVLDFGPHSFSTSPGGGAAWARSFLDQVFPLPEKEFRTGADSYLLSAAPLFGLMRTVEEPQASYRRHGGGDSSGSMRAYIEKAIGWDLEICRLIQRHALQKGLEVGPNFWKRDTVYHRMKLALSDIEAIVPSGELFIIADQGEMQSTDLFSGHHCLPFMNKDGVWWGNPLDDETAVGELHSLRNQGAKFLVITWLSFWYFDSYPDFGTVLREKFKCILSNDRVVIFDLT